MPSQASAPAPQSPSRKTLAVVITEWDEFKKVDWRNLALAMANPLLIDLRNLFSLQEAGSIGINYISLGRDPIIISH